jgi:Ca2+-binding RTX toxin-like protein
MLNFTTSGKVGWILCSAACAGILASCGGEKEMGGTGGAGGHAGSTAARAGTGGKKAAAGSGAASGAAGKSPAADGGMFFDEDGGVLTPEQQYEGIPFDATKGAAPAGCADNTQGDASTLVLELDAKTNGLRLAAPNGHISANGTLCDAEGVSKIRIIGASTADTVIIDASQGAFPAALLASDGLIEVDLGDGKDVLAIMGSADIDNFKLGSSDTIALIQTSARLPRITTTNQETLIVSAGPGDDRIEGSGLATPLNVALKAWGGLGSDALSGGSKDDELHGGQDDDVFETAAKPDGADVYDGGGGVDTISYDLRTAPISVKMNDAADDGEANERDNVQATIEAVAGGSAGDTFIGSDADNTFIGGPGNDTMNGGGGNDTFIEASAAQGNDIMNGGEGSDLVDYSGRTLAMTISLCISTQPGCAAGACGCAANDGEEGENDTLANIENVSTGSGNDKINCSSADNVVTAGAGNDEIHGMAGDDTLFGEGGNDTLDGAEGDDALYGGPGTDRLEAGEGQGDICIFEADEVLKGCELR